MSSQTNSLQMLRNWRCRPAKDLTIVKDVKDSLRRVQADHRRAGAAANVWESCAPASIRRACAAGGSGGTLVLTPASAASRFQVDRWLRGGGEAALRSGGVAKIVVR